MGMGSPWLLVVWDRQMNLFIYCIVSQSHVELFICIYNNYKFYVIICTVGTNTWYR